ncbi:MAG: hypothetical protein H5T68_03850 [Chloroflexi bacterium]|nr:hypothetical protein [Chloroflexota bacterium]
MHPGPRVPCLEGWEKLYAERVAMAYGRRYGMKVRIARFENCYGPEGTLRQAQGRPGPAGRGRFLAAAGHCPPPGPTLAVSSPVGRLAGRIRGPRGCPGRLPPGPGVEAGG